MDTPLDLQRYDIYADAPEPGLCVEESTEGEWIKVEDLLAALAASADSPPAR